MQIEQIKPDLALPGNRTYASVVIKDLTPETVDVTQENKEMGATTIAGGFISNKQCSKDVQNVHLFCSVCQETAMSVKS